jgi:citrate synthase
MSSPCLVASPDGTVAEAAAAMCAKGVGSVVVVDEATKRLVGILTKRDLVRIAAAGVDTRAVTVREWMTKNPRWVARDVDVSAAFDGLSQHGDRHIPVVEHDVVVGMVSMRDLLRIAQIQPVARPADQLPRGLEGVLVAETAIGDVRGTEGFYHYRQYNAVELAEKRSLEDVWHLAFEGELPTRTQAAAFVQRVSSLRKIPDKVMHALREIVRLGRDAPPLDLLRTAVSLLGAHGGFRPSLDIADVELRTQALQVCAVVPTLLTAIYRLQHDLEPVDPSPQLGFAANYLYMLSGVEPSAVHARAVEQYMISTVDHGFNASTFAARVITSTGADLAAAVTGGIGALSGPLHGAAPSRALDMIDAIGTIDNAEPWLRDAVGRGERLMGFGHRVYKTDDPRSVMLRKVAQRLGGAKVALAAEVEAKAIAVLSELKPGRRLYTNVEFYAGVVMDAAGLYVSHTLPRDSSTLRAPFSVVLHVNCLHSAAAAWQRISCSLTVLCFWSCALVASEACRSQSAVHGTMRQCVLCEPLVDCTGVV